MQLQDESNSHKIWHEVVCVVQIVIDYTHIIRITYLDGFNRPPQRKAWKLSPTVHNFVTYRTRTCCSLVTRVHDETTPICECVNVQIFGNDSNTLKSGS
jgi:hypothetical protein